VGNKIMTERRYDVDWMRIIAMLAIFFFHCTRFFDPEGWHLKNNDQSEILFVSMRGIIWPWVMELFFLLSGIGTWYALKSKSATSYMWERVKRLLIPLYGVGLFVLLPIQFYFEKYTNSGYERNFWQLIPNYFSSLNFPRITLRPDNLLPMPFSGHLWFLQYLFLISLLTLPLLIYLKSENGKRSIAKLAGWCNKQGGIFLFVIPISGTLIGLRILIKDRFSWADLSWYAIFFVIGYMIAADKQFTRGIKKHRWICLVTWILGFMSMGLIIQMTGYDPYPGKESFSLVFILFQIVWSLTSWSAVVFVLSMGAIYLNKNHKFLEYGNEAVLPFYLFHQTIILCVGWYVISWDMGITTKFMIISVISFVIIMILYTLFIRYFNIMRFFFGMRPRKGTK
jgi:glucan biosynthesis protein C